MKKSTPPPRTYEFSSSYSIFVLFIIAIGVLLFALISANFESPRLDSYLLFSWFASYECGYINRGLIGTLVKFIYAPAVTVEDLEIFVPVAGRFLFFFNLVLLWVLLAPRIVLGRFTPSTKWMLMAFTAVTLTAPHWKVYSYFVTTLDNWVNACALLSLAALIFKRPVLFAVFIITGFMIHRLMLPFAALLFLLVLHAVWRHEDFRRRARVWLSTIAACFLLMGMSMIIANDPVCSLQRSNMPQDSILWESLKYIHSTNYMIDYLLNKWTLYPYTFLLGLLFFFAPTVLVAALFIWGCSRANLQFGDGEAVPIANHRLSFLLSAGERMLPLFGVLATVGMIFVALDFVRVLFWSWFGLTLIIVYYVWLATAPAAKQQQQRKVKQQQQRKIINPLPQSLLTVFMFTIAYGFGGSPFVLSNIDYPQLAILQCRQWCLRPLSIGNPLGDWYAASLRQVYGTSGLPFYASAAQAKKLADLESQAIRDFILRNGKLIIPQGFTGKILTLEFTIPAGARFSYTIRHDSKTTAPLRLTINDYDAAPTAATLEATTWQYVMQKESRLIFKVYGNNAEELAIKDFAFDITTPPKY